MRFFLKLYIIILGKFLSPDMMSLTQMLINAQFNVKFEDSVTENRVNLEVL